MKLLACPNLVRRLALVGVFVAACGPGSVTPPPPPTEAEVAAYLSRVEAIVASGALATLCTLGSGTCAKTLQMVDLSTVPTTLPIVLGTRIVPSVALADGTEQIGGRVLELCGLDGKGAAYYSEVLVFHGLQGLLGKEPVYWTGIRIAESTGSIASPPPLTGCPVEGSASPTTR